MGALGEMMRQALRQSAIEAGELEPDIPANASTVDRIMERQAPGWCRMSRSEREAYWHRHYGWEHHVQFKHRLSPDGVPTDCVLKDPQGALRGRDGDAYA